jgi:hypothetical protein
MAMGNERAIGISVAPLCVATETARTCHFQLNVNRLDHYISGSRQETTALTSINEQQTEKETRIRMSVAMSEKGNKNKDSTSG